MMYDLIMRVLLTLNNRPIYHNLLQMEKTYLLPQNINLAKHLVLTAFEFLQFYHFTAYVNNSECTFPHSNS